MKSVLFCLLYRLVVRFHPENCNYHLKYTTYISLSLNIILPTILNITNWSNRLFVCEHNNNTTSKIVLWLLQLCVYLTLLEQCNFCWIKYKKLFWTFQHYVINFSITGCIRRKVMQLSSNVAFFAKSCTQPFFSLCEVTANK